jgi:heme-degrading monooxygenase HmoA
MFARVGEATAQPGKIEELCRTITEKVVPLMKKQAGFRDEILLVSDTEPSRVLSLSFWNSREEAEHYHREIFPKVLDLLRDLAQDEPSVGTYDVETSTAHRIALGRAA